MDKRSILLKLHYLSLEIHQIHGIIDKLNPYKRWTEPVLKSCLGVYYNRYRSLDLQRLNDELKCKQVGILTIYDACYPETLKNIYRPPLVLFYRGDLNLLQERRMAVIGSREHTAYGKYACEYFVSKLVEHDYVIVSGLARGIDGIAHQVAINENGKTIAILGSGFDHIYPAEHIELAQRIARDHLLLSEYPPHERPHKTHFPFRNRIVSGISEGVVVIEAAKRSGTLITSDYALDQGKDVFAVPGPIFSQKSQGTNELIQQGAKLIQTIEDILE